MAYFECISGGAGGGATITVTYDSSFYNKTITCSNGSKTYTKTTTSSGSTEFSVSDEGTWTITCNGVSVAVDVTLNYATQMKPTGSTATPVNNIQLWLKCGGIFNKNYTTINQVLADTTTLLALISDNNAVDYMVRSTNWANSVCANATAMTDIGANNYCADTLLSDATWASAICNSTYFESVLNVKIPTMTSATTPSGNVTSSGDYGGYLAYKAFDGNTTTISEWIGSNAQTTDKWIAYEFTDAVNIVYFTLTMGDLIESIRYKIQAYINGHWTDISNEYTTQTSGVLNTHSLASIYRLYVIETIPTQAGIYLPRIAEIQFYGRTS